MPDNSKLLTEEENLLLLLLLLLFAYFMGRMQMLILTMNFSLSWYEISPPQPDRHTLRGLSGKYNNLYLVKWEAFPIARHWVA